MLDFPCLVDPHVVFSCVCVCVSACDGEFAQVCTCMYAYGCTPPIDFFNAVRRKQSNYIKMTENFQVNNQVQQQKYLKVQEAKVEKNKQLLKKKTAIQSPWHGSVSAQQESINKLCLEVGWWHISDVRCSDIDPWGGIRLTQLSLHKGPTLLAQT